MPRAAILLLALVASTNIKVSSAFKVDLDPESWLQKAKDKLGDKTAAVGGEIGIGFGAGFTVGFVGKKVQSTLINSVVLGACTAGAACMMKWTTPEELMDRAKSIFDQGQKAAEETMEQMPDLTESKKTLTQFAKAHPGAGAGFATGALAGYKLG